MILLLLCYDIILINKMKPLISKENVLMRIKCAILNSVAEKHYPLSVTKIILSVSRFRHAFWRGKCRKPRFVYDINIRVL